MRQIARYFLLGMLFYSVTAKAQFSGGSGSGYSSSQPITGLLPVVLTDFKANCWGKGHAEIKWSTSYEFNSSHFELYRSYDGNEFEWIAREQAADFSNEIRNYQVVDPFVFAQNEPIVYYALAQYDKDGLVKRFPTIATLINQCGTTDKQTLFFVSTQGHSNGFYLKLNESSQHYHYELRDVIGKTIQEGSVHNEATFSQIERGVYFLSIDFMGIKQTQKVIIY